MLETFRQLCIIASSTFSRISDVLNNYLGATRNKPTFGREMLIIGSDLGLCHHALSQCVKLSTSSPGIVSLPSRFRQQYWSFQASDLAGFYEVDPYLFERLKFYGHGFDSEGFEKSSQADILTTCDIHFRLRPVDGVGSHGSVSLIYIDTYFHSTSYMLETYRTNSDTLIEGSERLLDPNLSGAAKAARPISMGLHSACPKVSTCQGLSFKENPHGHTSTVDAELGRYAGQPLPNHEPQVDASQTTETCELDSPQRQVRFEISQLQHKRVELQKRMKAKIANYDKKITLLQARLSSRFVRPPGSQNNGYNHQVEQILPLATPVLSGADNNASVKHEASLSLEKGPRESSQSPCRSDDKTAPMTKKAVPSFTPQCAKQDTSSWTKDQDLPPSRKRKRACGI